MAALVFLLFGSATIPAAMFMTDGYVNAVDRSITVTVLEPSRPLEDETVKAPADSDGDSIADTWAFGEHLPGDTATVWLNAEGVSVAERHGGWVLFIWGTAVVVFVLGGAFTSLLIHEHGRYRRDTALHDLETAELTLTPPSDEGAVAIPPRLNVWGQGLTWWGTRYRLFAAVSPRTNRVRLAMKLAHPIHEVAVAAATNPRTPLWTVPLVLRLRPGIRAGIIKSDSRLPTSIIARYCTPRSSEPLRLAGATHPHAPRELVHTFVSEPGLPSATAITILDSPAADDTVFEVLCERALNEDLHCSWGTSFELVLKVIARGHRTPHHVLHRIATECDDRAVLKEVAHNPNTESGTGVMAALRAS